MSIWIYDTGYGKCWYSGEGDGQNAQEKLVGYSVREEGEKDRSNIFLWILKQKPGTTDFTGIPWTQELPPGYGEGMGQGKLNTDLLRSIFIRLTSAVSLWITSLGRCTSPWEDDIKVINSLPTVRTCELENAWLFKAVHICLFCHSQLPWYCIL